MQEKIPVGENETAGELHDRLKILGADVLVKTIKAIADKSIKEQPQIMIHDSQSAIKHAPKINAETCKIDWNENADNIFNLIRGLSPYPAAFTYLHDKMLKIYFGKKEIEHHQFTSGDIKTDGKTFLKFACADGFIHCTDIQLQGKKE